MADEIGTMPDVLARICAGVRADVAARKAVRGIDALRNEIAARNDPPRGFAYALKSASMSGRYRPFWELTRAGLRFAAQRLGLDLNSTAEDRLMNQYRHLSSFPENREVLAALKARGISAGILSNGDPDMLGVAVKSAGFSGLLDHVISVHALRKFKTDPATYALGTQALNLPAKDILFVSSNGWDAIGATWAGYTTLWVNRSGGPLEQLDTAPTRTGTSLRDVLGFF